MLTLSMYSEHGGMREAVVVVCSSPEGMNRGDLIIAQTVWRGLQRWR